MGPAMPPLDMLYGKENYVPNDASAELEKSEQRYRDLFNFVPFSLILLDRSELVTVFETLKSQGVYDLRDYAQGNPGFAEWAMNSIKVRDVNQRTVDLFVAGNAAQLLGSAAWLWSESPETFVRSMKARFEGEARFEAEIKIRTFDGRIKTVLYVTYFPEAFQNEPVGLACLVDVTDRIKTQELLEQVQADFAHSARVSMLGELTSSISHEINQPLTSIVIAGEAALLWLDRPKPDLAEVRAIATQVIEDARRAAGIVQGIRRLAGHKQIERTPVAPNDIVQDTMLFLRPELRRNKIEVALDLALGLAKVIADRVQLQQVVANISLNAIQAMACSDSARHLTVRTWSADNGNICIEIQDTGPGIAVDALPHIFQSFFSTKKEGMGIGLAICRTIIEAHGGSIEASNILVGGARFRFVLPTA
jgi:C4-dicarboxylate-specific signal transduction histidine kinase